MPKLTGNYAVGRTFVLWTDSSRQENPALGAGPPRHIPAYIYYPALRGTKIANYYPRLSAVKTPSNIAALASQFGDAWKLVQADTIETHSFEDAPLSKGKETFPILFFSPGMGLPVSSYSAQLENLASHGYVVVALEHPYDTALVVLPDGTTIIATPEPDSGPPTMEGLKKDLAREDVRMADTEFALLHLTEIESQKKQLKGRLDTQRIGILGHSMGGKVAVRICQSETRFRGCLNQDGGLFNADPRTLTIVPAVEPAQSTKAPLFNIDVKFAIPPIPDETIRKQIAQWQQKKTEALAAFLSQNRSQTYIASIATEGFSHLSFTDIPLLSAIATGKDTRNAATNLEMVNEFNLVFFDAVLKQEQQALKSLLVQHPKDITMRATSVPVQH